MFKIFPNKEYLYKKKNHSRFSYFLFLIISSFVFLHCTNPNPNPTTPNSIPWISAEDWRKSGTYILSPYGKIFTRDMGEGEVVLFLHGFPTSSYDFYPLTQKIKKRLLLLDLLGFGYSDKPKEIQYSYKIQADIIEDFLKQKQVEEFTIVAHDYSVTLAQELLARNIDREKSNTPPSKIKGVIFLNGGLFPEAHRPRLMQRILLSPIGKYVSKWITKNMFQKAFLEVFGENTRPSSFELEEMWKIIGYQDGNHLSHKLLHYIQERQDNRSRYVEPLISGSTPYILINGSDDPVSGDHVVQRYIELTGKDQYFRLPGIGHYPQTESDEEVSKIILNFLEKNSSRK